MNIGPMTYCLTMSSAAARSAGVKSMRSSTVTPCRSNAGGFVGNGCVADVCSPGVFDCGTGRSSIGHTGWPVDAIEHEGKRLLRQLHDGPDPTAVDCDVRQNRRGWQIVVPQIVMHELVVPHAFARLALDADQRVRKQIVARPMPAVHVAGRTRERQIRVAEFFVDADERPQIRMPGVLPRVVLPRIDTKLAGSRNDMKGPAQLARCGRRSPSHRRESPPCAAASRSSRHQR